MTAYSPGSKSIGSIPMRTFDSASAARLSGSIASSRHPLLCAHPDELLAMITVEASAMVERCSAKMPFEFATPIANDDVVMEPAAEHPADSAFLQNTPALTARSPGVHSATALSNADIAVMAWGAGSPLNSGLSG